MTQNNFIDHPSGAIWDQTQQHSGGHQQRNQQPKSLPAIRQRAAQIIAKRERDEHHADLADPNIKRTPKIPRQKPRADNFQDHDDKSANKNQTGGSDSAHRQRVSFYGDGYFIFSTDARSSFLCSFGFGRRALLPRFFDRSAPTLALKDFDNPR